jgi:hypothetical protein
MFPPKRKPFLSLLALGLLFVGLQTGLCAQTFWRPVSPAELQMKTPLVEPDADAEAIFWEVRLDDKKSNRLSYSHYVRVKIFTERGRERFSKFDIPFMKGKRVENVAARVIKPDGSAVELKPTDIFERDIITVRKTKIKAKSFAVPAIEPGVIVEYQYDEIIKNDSASGERLIFQREIPMQKVTYLVRPYKSGNLAFKAYNMPEMSFTQDTANKGFYTATLTNVPSLKEEPYMPPDDEVRKWVYLHYEKFGTYFQWRMLSNFYSELLNKYAKPNKEIQQKAAELTAGITSEEQKLIKIYEFVQKEIKNLSYDRTLTEEQREDIKVKDADDALRKRAGNAMFIDLLFASLVRAAGFDVRVVLAGDLRDNFFTPEKYPYPSFVQPVGIAVKSGPSGWKFFNPGTPYMPYGRMFWFREDMQAMVVGENDFSWQKLPLSDHRSSPARRTANLKLFEDGTLEGTVRIEYDGHQAINRRREGFLDSPAKREEDFKEEFKQRMSAAEIIDLRIENLEDPSKPLAYSFKVRVPNYAQRTGRRLFFQPGFFEYGSSPAFSTATRTHNIYFPYPWSENDDIRIELPENFELDNAEAPPTIADQSKIGMLDIRMSIDKAGHALICKRRFYFGGDGKILFPVSVYQPMKDLFDQFHKADTHTISLRQK